MLKTPLSLLATPTPKIAPESKNTLLQSTLYQELVDAMLAWGGEAKAEAVMLQRSVEESGTARQLKEQVKAYGYACKDMKPDGNCFFHAIADQLEQANIKKKDGHNYTYIDLRAIAVQHIIDNLSSYAGAIEGSAHTFIGKITQNREWADHQVIQAIARALNVTLAIVPHTGSNPIIVKRRDSIATLCLGYEVERHYQSLIRLLSLPIIKLKTLQQHIDEAPFDSFTVQSANAAPNTPQTPSPGVETKNSRPPFSNAATSAEMKTPLLKSGSPLTHSEQKEKLPSPCFVVNAAVYVPSDTETDSSDDEKEDANPYGFKEEDFNFDIQNPPFKVNPTTRGKIEDISPGQINPTIQQQPRKSRIKQRIVDKLAQEGFVAEGRDSKIEARDRLGANFGLNRPKSLSSGKNKVLYREMTATVEPTIAMGSFGFFWNYPWERRKNIRQGVRSSYTEYAEVRSFYRQLKRRNPEKAREFRRANENQARNGMVPYREIREKVKTHPHTTELVQRARNQHPNSDVYLSFVDGDTKSFNKDREGVYAAYTRLHATHGAPDVMSTGYEYLDAKDHGLIQFASLLDRRVRAATARHVPRGIYYPEPNFCIKVLKGKNTVEESFYELTPKGKESKANYESPSESVIILDKVAKRPGYKTVFASDSPLLTSTPARAQKNKQGTPLSFRAELTNKRFSNWNWQDVVNVTRNIAQSHVKSRDWAIYLLNAYSCAPSVMFGTIKLIHGAEIRNMAISLLSRLFTSYDPISMIDSPQLKSKDNDKNKFLEVLTRYDELASENNLPTIQRKEKKKKKLPLEKKQRVSHKNTKTDIQAAWSIVDSFSTRAQIKAGLKALLMGCDPEQIEMAARASGGAIRETFIEFFDMPNTMALQSVSKKLDFSSPQKETKLISRVADTKLETTLRGYAEKGATKEIIALIETGGKLSSEDYQYYIAIAVYAAAQHGAVGVVKELLERYGNFKISAPPFIPTVSYSVSEGALFLATEADHLSVVQYLLTTRRVNITRKDYFGDKVLFVAIDNGSWSVVEWLLTNAEQLAELSGSNAGLGLLLDRNGRHRECALERVFSADPNIIEDDARFNMIKLLIQKHQQWLKDDEAVIKWIFPIFEKVLEDNYMDVNGDFSPLKLLGQMKFASGKTALQIATERGFAWIQGTLTFGHRVKSDNSNRGTPLQLTLSLR